MGNTYQTKVRYISTFKGRMTYLLAGSKQSAKKRNIYWDLKKQDLIDLYEKQEGKCALTNDPLTLEVQSRDVKECASTISLDRIDNEQGYIPDNIQFVTFQANVAKNSFSTEQLLDFCRKVLKTKGE